MKVYKKHQELTSERLIKLLESGKTIVEMSKETGKHNTDIKAKLIQIYGNRIEFRQGRGGGIFVDGKGFN